ncbi:distal tail protein Dit, partial [Acinetobacter baumannii]|uniref:distal tail protein Dit n=1 Tax=Acinetobacter baumannii TaxID=470 RepID=UPI0010FD48C4
QLPFYRTLNVSGRENFERSLNTVETSGDGEFFLSSKLNANSITVTYSIETRDADTFNETFTNLKKFLLGEEVEFYFMDEPEYTRTGTVTKLENPTAGAFDVIGTFEIAMSDPFRHGQRKTITGGESLVINDPQLFYKQRAEKMILNIKTATKPFVLNVDNDYNLTLTGGLPANSNLVIDFAHNTLTYIGTNKLADMDILVSIIFELTIKNGHRITAKGAGSIELQYKVQML